MLLMFVHFHPFVHYAPGDHRESSLISLLMLSIINGVISNSSNSSRSSIGSSSSSNNSSSSSSSSSNSDDVDVVITVLIIYTSKRTPSRHTPVGVCGGFHFQCYSNEYWGTRSGGACSLPSLSNEI